VLVVKIERENGDGIVSHLNPMLPFKQWGKGHGFLFGGRMKWDIFLVSARTK